MRARVCGDGVLVSENGLVRKSSTRSACGSKTTRKNRSTETKRTRFTNITPSQHCCCSCAWSSYSSCWSPGESGFETTMGPVPGHNRAPPCASGKAMYKRFMVYTHNNTFLYSSLSSLPYVTQVRSIAHVSLPPP